MSRAAIYVRISDDRLGEGLGVARQERDCRRLAARLGWTVAEVYTDNDISATSGKRRPAYERLLADIEAGAVGAVVVWDVDRLTRRPAELEAFILLAERHGTRLASVGGDIDLATPQGQLTARIKGAVARHEAQQIQRRIQAKVDELAAAGRIANGGPRPFGYRRIYAGEGTRRKIVRDELDPVEAAVVREVAHRALSREPLRAIVRDLNRRGVPTSTGGRWSQQGLRAMLRSGRIAGLREHRGQVVGPAVWPAIITREQHEILRALLDSAHRPPGSRVRVHYLSGYVLCSDCRIKMRVCPQAGRLKYKCLADSGGCNGRVIGLAELEDLLGRYVVARLADPELAAELAQREAVVDTSTRDLLAAIEADEARLQVLTEALSTGDDLPEVIATVRVVRERIAKAREALARQAGAPAGLRAAVGVDLDEWNRFDLDAKRAILGQLVEAVVIYPARRGLARFDPERVDVVAVASGKPL